MIQKQDILQSYQKFIKGKRKKIDVCNFILKSEEEINLLYKEIKERRYKHKGYSHFRIFDPKLREIDKASVRDRVVHQLVYDELVKIFDRTFYFHSYAARKGKGLHKAVNFLEKSIKIATNKCKKNVFILKCDIKKFFASIDKNILYDLILKKNIENDCLYLVREIIKSFNPGIKKGVPLGNLTSQIFANIYLNELDRFVKHNLKIRYYGRYMDDFIIIGQNKEWLEEKAREIDYFLEKQLNLQLHPDKVIIKKSMQGIDFLGYVQSPYWRILRIKTKKRMFRNLSLKYNFLKQGLISKKSFNYSVQSYLGVLKHCYFHNLLISLASKYMANSGETC